MELSPKHPHAAGSLLQTYNDLKFAQQWHDIDIVELEKCSRSVINGKRHGTETILHVVPCSLSEFISLSWLQDVFTALSNPSELYLAITSDDSSIVYYKISHGIVKPPM